MATKTNNNRTTANTARAKARAAGAKLPEDHQTASNDVNSDIVEFEYDGYVYEIDTDKFDDLEIMDTLQISMRRGLNLLLGSDQFEALRDNLKANDPKGIFRVTKAQDFITKMQEAIGPLA